MLNMIGFHTTYIKLITKRSLTLILVSLLVFNFFIAKSASAIETTITESVAPAFVFLPQCCVDAEFSNVSTAFSAIKGVWDQNNTLPGGAVVHELLTIYARG